MDIEQGLALRVRNRVEQYHLFGLVAFHLVAPDLEESDQIRIRVDEWSRDFALPELRDPFSSENPYSLTFHLVTMLLPNGATQIVISRLRPAQHAFKESIICAYDANISNRATVAEKTRLSLSTAGSPVILGAIIDSAYWPYGEYEPKPWFDVLPSLENIELSFDPPVNTASARAHLHRWGFCVLPDLYPAEKCDALNNAVDREIAAGRIKHQWGSSERLHDVHRLPEGRDIWSHPPVLRFLHDWFDDDPVACQTLYYAFGSEQSAHQDTIHLTPFPSGYMCGVWVSLQDVEPDSGELFVYPGSHVLPRLRAGELGLKKVRSDYSSYAVFDAAIRRHVEAHGFRRTAYRPKKGQILVWHENLVHGGNPRRDKSLARRSIVSHYFARGAIAYYDARGEAAGLEDVI